MIVTVKNKQSLMDITVEKYGQIDNLLSVSNDNGLSISEILETSQELTVNSENKGDQEIKDKIVTQGLSFNNNTVPSIVFSLWFLPSLDELDEIRLNLFDFGVGDLDNGIYWSSSEGNLSSSWNITFSSGNQLVSSKGATRRVRACRSFNTNSGIYNLRSIGPGGGLIFLIDGETFYEAAPSDQSSSQVWSNITGTAINTTSTDIGTGSQNTLDIITQVGHTDSAAKLCNDLN